MPIYRRANVLLARLSDSEILFHDVRYYTVAEISATSPPGAPRCSRSPSWAAMRVGSTGARFRPLKIMCKVYLTYVKFALLWLSCKL